MKMIMSKKVFRDEVQFPRGNGDVQQQSPGTYSEMLRGIGSSHSSQATKYFQSSVRYVFYLNAVMCHTSSAFTMEKPMHLFCQDFYCQCLTHIICLSLFYVMLKIKAKEIVISFDKEKIKDVAIKLEGHDNQRIPPWLHKGNSKTIFENNKKDYLESNKIISRNKSAEKATDKTHLESRHVKNKIVIGNRDKGITKGI
ncbi:hypothetical protein DUI87_16203 [Hirundo rustica rustica]|uniref:Uncharacterized protein n=1 Tax=Hirundo rustica rustica TaxID=333673 RepID=A0A3M0KHV4_HIRRU|nr:hypothetical protein DUI87_16203 [Hirundo rustica rustica]